MTSANTNTKNSLDEALEELTRRQAIGYRRKVEIWFGHFENKDTFVPNDGEELDCCRGKTGFNLYKHLQSAKHIANRFGVETLALKRAAKQVQRTTPPDGDMEPLERVQSVIMEELAVCRRHILEGADSMTDRLAELKKRLSLDADGDGTDLDALEQMTQELFQMMRLEIRLARARAGASE